ncbi:MAG: hypothetical protein RL417_472 [Pseudomonadota bacterium]|jgi:hypothetical protein
MNEQGAAPTIVPDFIDTGTCAFYLVVPSDKVVLLQAFFELYEGLGIVRTLNLRKSLVCILTTPSMIDDCRRALEAIRSMIPWGPVARPDEAERQLYLGYFHESRKE